LQNKQTNKQTNKQILLNIQDKEMQKVVVVTAVNAVVK
jgi:hypothetical protein